MHYKEHRQKEHKIFNFDLVWKANKTHKKISLINFSLIIPVNLGFSVVVAWTVMLIVPTTWFPKISAFLK